MGDTSQNQGSGQSHYDFLLDIAGQVYSLIKKNRPRFEQQVKKLETQYSDHRKVLMDAQRQARLKVNSHLRHEPGNRVPEGYVLYDINEYIWHFPREMVSCYILKSLLKLHPNPLDTLIERDKFFARYNSWDTQRNIDYYKNGEQVSDLPGEEICTKEEDELRQYYLLSVIHAFMTDDPAVVSRKSKPAMSVWDRFKYQRFTTIHMDRSGEKALIKRALKSVQDDIEAIPAGKGGDGEGQKKKGFGGWVWLTITGIIILAGGLYTFIQIWESNTVQKWINKRQTQKQVDNQATTGQIPVKNSSDPNQKKP